MFLKSLNVRAKREPEQHLGQFLFSDEKTDAWDWNPWPRIPCVGAPQSTVELHTPASCKKSVRSFTLEVGVFQILFLRDTPGCLFIFRTDPMWLEAYLNKFFSWIISRMRLNLPFHFHCQWWYFLIFVRLFEYVLFEAYSLIHLLLEAPPQSVHIYFELLPNPKQLFFYFLEKTIL